MSRSATTDELRRTTAPKRPRLYRRGVTRARLLPRLYQEGVAKKSVAPRRAESALSSFTFRDFSDLDDFRRLEPSEYQLSDALASCNPDGLLPLI